MTKLRTVLIVVCTLLLAGCLPVTSKTPVGTTVGLGADPALIGTWQGYDQEHHHLHVYLHIYARKDVGLIAVQVATGNKQEDGGVMLYQLKTTTLGANRFLDVFKFCDDGDQAKWTDLNGGSTPVLYRIAHHTLTLSQLDEDKVKAAIAAGAIAGTVEPGDYGDVQLTADAKTLDAFMARPETAKLYKILMVFRKTE
jgi:hypothetical protein